MRVAVLADTHAPRRWKSCPPRVARQLRQADVILHAGDVCTAAVLDELAQYAPVHAVRGNNDGPDVAAWGAAETAELDLDGLRVAMLHDSGQAAGRLRRMRRRFPRADLVVFGHSHIPLDQSGEGVRVFLTRLVVRGLWHGTPPPGTCLRRGLARPPSLMAREQWQRGNPGDLIP